MIHSTIRWVTALALLCSSAAQATTYSITTLDLPGASTSLGFDINNAGVFVGSAFIGESTTGYLVSGGVTTTLGGPAGAFASLAFGISDGGTVVGGYFNRDAGGTIGLENGFIYSSGSYTTLKYAADAYTELRGISADGRYVTGFAILPSGETRTFVFDRVAALFTDIFDGTMLSIAQGVTNAGLVVGSHDGSGFVYDLGTAAVTEFAIPGALYTSYRGISESGLIDGSYTDAAGTRHGFVGSHGLFDVFDIPGAKATYAEGINDAGWLAGNYDDAAGITHAFLARPVSVISEPPTVWLVLVVAIAAIGAARRRAANPRQPSRA